MNNEEKKINQIGAFENPTKMSPFYLIMKQNFPFIENTLEAGDYYGLLCKVVEYLNNVIDNLNINESNINFLNQNYIALKNYVDDYFTNLDVQNEINNKLDEMAENGTLTVLIEKLLNYQSNKLNYMLVNNQTPKLLFTGDSIIEGSSSGNIPEFLGETIKKIYNIQPTIINEALGGQTSQYGLNHVDEYISQNPDIIFWEFGINDSNQNLPITTTLLNLSNFYEKVSQAGIEMVVISAPLTYKQSSLIKTNYLMNQLNISIKNYCKKIGLRYIDLNYYIQKAYNSNSKYVGDEQADGTHFENDYKWLSDMIAVELLDSIYHVKNDLETFTNFKKGNYLKTNGTNTSYQNEFALGTNMFFSNINDIEYSFNVFVEKDTKLFILLFLNNKNGKFTFKIDNRSNIVINANKNPQNPNVAFPIPLSLEPGFHSIKITNFEPIGSACYVEGFLFKSITNLSKVSYEPLYDGDLSGSNENVSITAQTINFDNVKKAKLTLENNNFFYIEEVYLEKTHNVFTVGNTLCSITIVNSTTFNINNSTNYTLKKIEVLEYK